MQELFIVLVLGMLAFVGFVIYFIFKQIQFFIQATNLYKKMVERQDMMIKLLSEIRGAKISDSKGDEERTFASETEAHISQSTKTREENKDQLSEKKLMKLYNISFEGEKYIFQTNKYDKLIDAVNYARSVSKSS